MSLELLLVRVAPAAHGDGLYATHRIRRGERIGRVYGDVIHGDYGSEYAIDLGDHRLLEPAAPFRYMNHNCSPNCELVNSTRDHAAPDEYEVYVYARRPIAKGAELTIDYAWAADAAIRCGCQSENCRGWIVSEEELPALLAREADDEDE